MSYSFYKKCFFLLIYSLLGSFAFGQAPLDVGIRGLNFVGQNSQYQPAYIPQELAYNKMIGLSIGADVRSNWIVFSDIYTALGNSDRGKYLNLNSIFSKKYPLKSGILANADANIFFMWPLSLKRYHKKYFTLSIADKYLGGVHLTGNEFVFGSLPTGQSWLASQINKKIFTFANYIDFGLGYAQEWRKFDIGIKIHYLLGLQSFTDQTYMNVFSSDTVLKGNINTFIYKTNMDMYKTGSVVPYGQGLAIDLGIRFWIKSRWRIEAAVTDIGSILWLPSKNNTVNIKLNDLKHRYIDASNNGTAVANFSKYLDSVYSLASYRSTQSSYFTNLFPTISIASYYDISPSFTVGAMGQITLATFMPFPYVSAWVTYTSKSKKFELTSNIGYRDRHFLNFGLAASYNWTIFQGFIQFDNPVYLFATNTARNFNFRIGINYLFNKDSKVIYREEHPSIECPVPLEEGY